METDCQEKRHKDAKAHKVGLIPGLHEKNANNDSGESYLELLQVLLAEQAKA